MTTKTDIPLSERAAHLRTAIVRTARRLRQEAAAETTGLTPTSVVSITATRDTRDLLELIELREQYLDELTRRHPVEISRWLASGARAASNPMRFIEG